MKKQKAHASSNYSNKASAYYLDCACSLSIHKAKQRKTQSHQAAIRRCQPSR